jgi:hypothetical protein
MNPRPILSDRSEMNDPDPNINKILDFYEISEIS